MEALKRVNDDDFNIDRQYHTIEGNIYIGRFMGEDPERLSEGSEYYIAKSYHKSWDSLMDVIKKIKKLTFSETKYESFQFKFYYQRIGNSCYDIDLLSAWGNTVDWIKKYFAKDSSEYIRTDEFVFRYKPEFTAIEYPKYKKAGHNIIPITESILFNNQLKMIDSRHFVDLDTGKDIIAPMDIRYVNQLEMVYELQTGKRFESYM